MVNALTGFITTSVNVATAQDGTWSTTAIATAVLSLVICVGLGTGLTVYLWLLHRLRNNY